MLQRLLIADDQLMFGTAMEFMLEQFDENLKTTSVGSAADVFAILEQNHSFDLILIDYAMPHMNGLEALIQITEKWPSFPVAILSGFTDVRTVQKALDAGAIGWLPKTMNGESLLHALRFMAAGGKFVPNKIMEEISEHQTNIAVFTPTERRIAEYVLEGLSDKEIASKISNEPRTVQVHIRSLYRKVGAKNRITFSNIYREKY